VTLPLEDYNAIQQLYSRYTFAFDLRDIDAWVACYTLDGSFEWAEGGESIGHPPFVRKGHAELRALAEASIARPAGKGYHWNANLLLTPTATGVHGQCYLMFVRSPAGLGTIDVATHYSDDLVKIDGNWLFQRRVVNVLPY
jgi:hypothetical protein